MLTYCKIMKSLSLKATILKKGIIICINKYHNFRWMTAQTQLDVQFDLKTQIIKLKEQNTKLNIKVGTF